MFSSFEPKTYGCVNSTELIDGNLTFSDTDHWNEFGEIYFGKRAGMNDFYFDYQMSIMPNSSSPSILTSYKGMLVFRASDPEGQELWKYDPN